MLFHTGKIDWGQLRPSIWIDGELVGPWESAWTDKSKSCMRVEIKDVAEGRAQSGDIRPLIEEKRTDLEAFINGKLVPLMKNP